MQPSYPSHILFLCTGNSARSIMAEALLNTLGKGKYIAYSAGSHPTGLINPYTLTTLIKNHINIQGLRSKSWDEFTTPDAPFLHKVITVCNNAKNEVCPIFPGKVTMLHWDIPDPASYSGTEAEKSLEFQRIFMIIKKKIELLIDSLFREGM